MNARAQFIKGFASFHRISDKEAEELWLLNSARLPAEERREAEQMGFAMGFSAAELYSYIFQDIGGQERDTSNVIDFPSP